MIPQVLSPIGEAGDHRPASRRILALAGAGVFVVVLAAAALLPVPYVMLSPGPMTNTLGALEGEDLIVIEGRETYPTEGNLDLTTVSVSGGPGRRVDLVAALLGWIDPAVAVVPEEQVYPDGQTRQDVEQRNAQEMNLSQQYATAAALRALDIPITEVVVVQAVLEGSPADGVLEAADVVNAVDGDPVASPAEVRDAISSRSPGEDVDLTVERDGRELTETLTTRAAEEGPERAVVGFVPDVSFEFPFTVDFSLEDVGGPSAGMMFALGVIDKLTPGPLNGGEHVAGTGTIDPSGEIGPIGGIQQKLVAARDKDADLFLAPAGNCRQVAAATPEGLRVARVATLDDALEALEFLREGRAGDIPACSG